jgi:ABC-type dipeptide/oligopeptide/nickel transport system permease component
MQPWMHRFGRRGLGALVAIAGVLLLVFSLKHLVPGDPVDAMLGEQAHSIDRQALQRCLGLDQSLLQQMGEFLRGVGNGSLGHSCLDPNVTVASLIARAFPFTFSLALSSVAFALLLAVPLSLLCVWRPRGWIDMGGSVLALLGLAVPSLWLGPLLLRLFYVELGWLPGPADDASTFAALLLPMFTLGLHLAAIAKGLSRAAALRRHALRPALLPMVTVAGLQVAGLLGGAVVTERIFGRPGLGTLLLDALAVRDWKVIEGTVLVMACSYVVINLLVDLIYTILDPRLRTPEAPPT